MNLVINSSRIEKTLYNDHIQTNLSEKLKAATTIILDPTTEQITTPTTVPSTEPTNGYSPMSVPPVFHSNYYNLPLVVIVRSSTKPTHAPTTTSILDPTTEPIAVPLTTEPIAVPTTDHTSHRLVMVRPTIVPSATNSLVPNVISIDTV